MKDFMTTQIYRNSAKSATHTKKRKLWHHKIKVFYSSIYDL